MTDVEAVEVRIVLSGGTSTVVRPGSRDRGRDGAAPEGLPDVTVSVPAGGGPIDSGAARAGVVPSAFDPRADNAMAGAIDAGPPQGSPISPTTQRQRAPITSVDGAEDGGAAPQATHSSDQIGGQ